MVGDANGHDDSIRDDGGAGSTLSEPLLPASPPSPPPLVDGMPRRTSVLIKSLYFLDALGASAWGRFGAIYYNLHGIDSRRIGIIEGLNTSIPAVSMPMWGVLADRFRSRKLVWVVTQTASTVLLLQLALPAVYGSFAAVLAVSVGAKFFTSSGILDGYALDQLGTENKMMYGRYRLFASISWGIGSIVVGYVTDRVGFEPNFVVFGVLGALMIALVWACIPEPMLPSAASGGGEYQRGTVDDGDEEEDEEAEDDDEPDEGVGRVSEILALATRPKVLAFLV